MHCEPSRHLGVAATGNLVKLSVALLGSRQGQGMRHAKLHLSGPVTTSKDHDSSHRGIGENEGAMGRGFVEKTNGTRFSTGTLGSIPLKVIAKMLVSSKTPAMFFVGSANSHILLGCKVVSGTCAFIGASSVCTSANTSAHTRFFGDSGAMCAYARTCSGVTCCIGKHKG